MDNFVFRDGMDCVWIAADKAGYLGAFVTAGEAPIYARGVNDELLMLDEIESSILGLPASSDFRIISPMNNPVDFANMAKRGFFVYDWPDASRKKMECSGAYELISIPLSPRLVDELPAALQGLARNSILENILFKDRLAINPFIEFI